MAAEELNKPAGAPKPAAPTKSESNVGNGDMANLIGNVGYLIDSTIESVQGIISSVSSATGQLIDGVTSTINSEPVQGIIHNVNTVSGQLIEGVTTARQFAAAARQLLDHLTDYPLSAITVFSYHLCFSIKPQEPLEQIVAPNCSKMLAKFDHEIDSAVEVSHIPRVIGVPKRIILGCRGQAFLCQSFERQSGKLGSLFKRVRCHHIRLSLNLAVN